MRVALFIGRFQPFHKGHLDALNQIMAEADFLKIAIGSSDKQRTHDNPLSYEERKGYISSLVPYQNHTIYAIPDIEADDRLWLQNLQKIVGDFDIVFSGNPHVLEIMQEHKISARKQTTNLNISATMIREMIRNDADEFERHLVKKLPTALKKHIYGTGGKKK